MPRLAIIEQAVVEKARDILKEKPIPREALKALSALLPAVVGAAINQSAFILGVSTATVARLQAEIRKQEEKLPGVSSNISTSRCRHPRFS